MNTCTPRDEDMYLVMNYDEPRDGLERESAFGDERSLSPLPHATCARLGPCCEIYHAHKRLAFLKMRGALSLSIATAALPTSHPNMPMVESRDERPMNHGANATFTLDAPSASVDLAPSQCIHMQCTVHVQATRETQLVAMHTHAVCSARAGNQRHTRVTQQISSRAHPFEHAR